MTRELCTGWRRWTYRGQRRLSTRRIGHRLTGLALYVRVNLR